MARGGLLGETSGDALRVKWQLESGNSQWWVAVGLATSARYKFVCHSVCITCVGLLGVEVEARCSVCDRLFQHGGQFVS
jgi:hypothetical protein